MQTIKIDQMKLKFIFDQTLEPEYDLTSALQRFSHSGKLLSSADGINSDNCAVWFRA
jgi:hypothetical protein